uniref:Uncharacterized protein n=1 Tax=Anopheles farauti TaxID=69004 RepID=A0A182QAE5_9DIPT
MSQTVDTGDVQASMDKKSHRVQVRIPPPDSVNNTKLHDSQVISSREETLQVNLCESQQVGILRGLSGFAKHYSKSGDILKHLSVVYLYTILKAPPKWTPETFNEIVALESAIANTKLARKLPIPRNDKTYYIYFSNTLVKGRFATHQDHPGIHQRLERIKRGKAAIWKCDTNHFLIRRLAIGWYFYTMNLQDRPALMFFSCSQLMVDMVRESYGCTDHSKYFLRNLVLHSVQEDDMIRIVWLAKRSVGMKLISHMESILHGNICLARPSLERSLAIGLNVLERARDPTVKLRAWDNKLLNSCFKRNPQHWKVAEKIASFVRDSKESCYAIGGYELTCRTKPLGRRQRKHFEELVSYFLASCSALLIVGLDCCFLLWTERSFVYWFSPYRYSALNERVETVQNRACFLHVTNALAKASESLYEYLYELGVFPDNTIELLPMCVDDRPTHPSIPCEEDVDSLDDESLTIPSASEELGWTSFYPPTLHTPSELRLARQMLDVVRETAEERCN